MKKLYITLFILLSFLLTSCTYETVNNYYYGVDFPISEMSVKEKQLLDIINNYRQNHVPKLGVLVPERLATKVAIENNERMIKDGYPNHDYFNERHLEAKSNRYSENLCEGYNTAQAMFNAYMLSPAHKAVIDREDMTHLSISTIGMYNTCIFTNYNTIKK